MAAGTIVRRTAPICGIGPWPANLDSGDFEPNVSLQVSRCCALQLIIGGQPSMTGLLRGDASAAGIVLRSE